MDSDGLINERNTAIMRSLMEDALGAGRLLLLPELIAPGYVGHLAIGDHYGPEGVRIEFAAYRATIHGLVVTVDDLFASNGRVARRFTLRGTSRPRTRATAGMELPVVLHGIAIDRLEDGRLVESWIQMDDLALTL